MKINFIKMENDWFSRGRTYRYNLGVLEGRSNRARRRTKRCRGTFGNRIPVIKKKRKKGSIAFIIFWLTFGGKIKT